MRSVETALAAAGLLLALLGLLGCAGSHSSAPGTQSASATPPGQGATQSSGQPERSAQAAELRIRPVKLSAGDRKLALSELPAAFREGLTGTDEENARDLGLQAWAFEYENGPVSCWVELAETGQQTIEPARPGMLGMLRTPSSTKAQGRILFWLQPRSSPTMRPDLRQRLATDAKSVPDYFLALALDDVRVASSSRTPDFGKLYVPLWFGWDQADLKETCDPVTLQAGAKAMLLLLVANEKGVAEPRKVRLALKARKDSP